MSFEFSVSVSDLNNSIEAAKNTKQEHQSQLVAKMCKKVDVVLKEHVKTLAAGHDLSSSSCVVVFGPFQQDEARVSRDALSVVAGLLEERGFKVEVDQQFRENTAAGQSGYESIVISI